MPPRSSHQSRQPSTATQADAETTGKSPPSEEMNRQRRQSGDPRHPTFSQDMAPRVESMTWSVVIPWTRCKAAYASHEKLAESKIRVRSFDFATGQNADLSPQFFEPLPPSTVAELFAQTGGFSDPSSDVVKPGEEDDDWLSPQQEAWTMVETIKRELFGPGWRGIIPQHSAWRCYGNTNRHLSRHIRGDTEWQVHAIFRASTGPSADNQPWTGDSDYSVPHITCCLTMQHPLSHGELTVGELVALLWLAVGNASNRAYKHHHVFPVTLLCFSHRTIRVTQAVFDVRKQSFTVRMSPPHNFHNGLRPKWDEFLAVVGWLIAKPVGNTM